MKKDHESVLKIEKKILDLLRNEEYGLSRTSIYMKLGISRTRAYDRLRSLSWKGRVFKEPRQRKTAGRPIIMWKYNRGYVKTDNKEQV